MTRNQSSKEARAPALPAAGPALSEGATSEQGQGARNRLRAAWAEHPALITGEGERATRTQAAEALRAGPQAVAQGERPGWDGTTLCWRGAVVKCFTKPADNQRRVLDAFERAGWPGRIDDPARATTKLGRKRRRDTVCGLNTGQGPAFIRFHMDGAGGIRWEPG